MSRRRGGAKRSVRRARAHAARFFDDAKFDQYGYAFDPAKHKRHPSCRCKVPCVQRFECKSSLHDVADRLVPWCVGGDDEFCADCWTKERTARAS